MAGGRPSGNSSVGRARPCQGRGREFESRFPLQFLARNPGQSRGLFFGGAYSALIEARWQSGHAAACKAVYAGSIPTLASTGSARPEATSRRFDGTIHGPADRAALLHAGPLPAEPLRDTTGGIAGPLSRRARWDRVAALTGRCSRRRPDRRAFVFMYVREERGALQPDRRAR